MSTFSASRSASPQPLSRSTRKSHQKGTQERQRLLASTAKGTGCPAVCNRPSSSLCLCARERVRRVRTRSSPAMKSSVRMHMRDKTGRNARSRSRYIHDVNYNINASPLLQNERLPGTSSEATTSTTANPPSRILCADHEFEFANEALNLNSNRTV